ncbi:MAG: twitching motility protein PilT [Dehalococcoidia bacterium]|nr:MAG: twitching motility protein PilT [Dehalococcoidia bacterium]
MSAARLLSAVVDTNIFVSAVLSPRGTPARILAALQSSSFQLISSRDQQQELADVLAREALFGRYQVSRAERDDFIELFGLRARLVEPTKRLPVSVRDPKDSMLLAAALGGRADYLVSGDSDLLELAGDPRLGRLSVLTAAAFVAVLDEARRS